LKLYPKSYQKEFGKEMQYVFNESLKDAHAEHGAQGVVGVWSRAIIDAGKSIFVQHLESHKGVKTMATKSKDLIKDNKVFAYIVLVTGALLLIPLIAMQFTEEVDWKLGDFVIMGTLLFGTGFLFVHTARVTPKKYRTLLGIGFLFALFVMWVHLAVGIVDTWPLAGS
jgi:hypothetical protein